MRNFGFVGLIFFILSVNTSLCQSRYWIATSASNWNNTANWSATSGGTGGASVPGSANAVIFDANGLGNCSLDMAPTISSITINGYTGTIDLSGNSFTITSTSTLTFTTGTITNTGASASLTFTTTSSTTFNGTTVSVNISGTSGTLTFSGGSTFNGTVSMKASYVYLNGCTYNGTTYIEKTGGSQSQGNGGNTFNAATTLVNSGSGYLATGYTSADIFNADLTATNTGSGWVALSDGAVGTQFKGNIILNSTSTTSSYTNTGGAGITFGNNPGTTTTGTLAIGKTISVGSIGFTGGRLLFRRFTQSGSTAQSFTLTGTARLDIGNSSTFNGAVTFKAPQLMLNGSTFNGTTYLEKTGATDNSGNGSNIFNGTTTLANSGSGSLESANTTLDTFNGPLTITNSGSNAIYMAHNIAGTVFNDNVVVNCTSGTGIYFCNKSTSATATLATGKTITVGSSGFTTGTLLFKQFTQIGSTAQAMTLTGTGILTIGPTSTFNGAVTFKAPQLMLNGCTYNSTTYLEKTGATDNAGNGGNVFNGTTTIANSGSGYISSAFTTLDTFNGQLTLTNTGSNAIYMAHKVPGTVFNGNVIVNSTAGIGINFCNNSAATASLANGKTITVGGSGFTAGTLTLQRFTQVGSTSQSLTLTGTSILTLGPSSTFNGDVTFKSPQLLLNGCTYNGVTYLEKTGATDNDSNGSNIFNSTTTLANSGSGYLLSANTTLDTFNGQLTLTNTGSNAIYMAHNVSGTVFNGNIIVNSTAGTGIYFCRNSTGAASLASGKTITIGGSGFTSGLLALQRFTQVGSTPQSLTLTGTATLHIGPSSTFGGNVTFISPQVYLNGCTFNGITSIEKNGVTNNLSTGGNTFAGTTTLTNSSTAIWYLAGTTADIFNSSVVFIQSSTGSLLPAYMGTNYFYGDITISSSSVITFGSSGTGIVQLDGGTNQTITSASSIPVIQQLIVNKSSTTNTVTLSSPVSISTSATLTSGIVNTTSTNYLNFADNATVTGASNSSYVNGPVRKTGNDAFVFPVGASNLYRAITMSAPSLTTDKFTAQYFYSAQPYGGSSTWDPSLYSISQCDYWILDRTTGTSSVTVKLSWNDSSCPGGTGYIENLSDLRVARFNSATSTWVNEGNGGTTGTTSIGTVISGAAVTSFSPFAIATVSSSNPLPIELRFFKASAERNNKVMLTWETASEKNNDFFTIERSGDGETFESIKKIDGAGNSSLPIDYASTDNAPLGGFSYYRLKQTDFDGRFSYSRIVAVQIDASSTLYLYPNPSVGGEFFVQLSEQNDGSSKITISDAKGVIVYNKNVEVSNGLIHVEKIENLASGFYRVHVEGSEGVHTYKLIVN